MSCHAISAGLQQIWVQIIVTIIAVRDNATPLPGIIYILLGLNQKIYYTVVVIAKSVEVIGLKENWAILTIIN